MKILKKSEVTKGFTTIYSYAQSMIDKLPEKVEVEEGEFIIKTLKDLGFTGWTKTSDFMNNDFLEKHSLSLCEPLQAIQYLKNTLKKGEYAYIAMEPITDSVGARTSSAWHGTATVCGSATVGRAPFTGGIRAIGSCSSASPLVPLLPL